MPIMHELKFDKLPSLSDIQDRVKKISGLSIVIKNSSSRLETYVMNFDEKEKVILLYKREKGIIEVTTMSNFSIYLFYTTLHALEEIGGVILNTPFTPRWKGRKWSEKHWWNFSMNL